jgi:hypothetical protein
VELVHIDSAHGPDSAQPDPSLVTLGFPDSKVSSDRFRQEYLIQPNRGPSNCTRALDIAGNSRPTDECGSALVIQHKVSPSVSSDALSDNTFSHIQMQFVMPGVKRRTRRNEDRSEASSAQSSLAAGGPSDVKRSNGHTIHQLPLKLSKEVASNDISSPHLVDSQTTEAKFGASSQQFKHQRRSDWVLHANETLLKRSCETSDSRFRNSLTWSYVSKEKSPDSQGWQCNADQCATSSTGPWSNPPSTYHLIYWLREAENLGTCTKGRSQVDNGAEI